MKMPSEPPGSIPFLGPNKLWIGGSDLRSEQRVVGVFPHLLVTYDPNAAPLTAGQKFHLGFKTASGLSRVELCRKQGLSLA